MNQYVLHHHLTKMKGCEISVFDGKSYILAIPFVDYKFYNTQADGKLVKIKTVNTSPDSGYFDFKKHESIIELPDEWEYFECGSSKMVGKHEFTIKPILVGYNEIVGASDNMLSLNTSKSFGRDYILNIDNLIYKLGLENIVKYQFKKHRNHSYDDVDYGYLIVYDKTHPNTKVCIDSHGYDNTHIAVENFESFEKIKKKLLKLKELIEDEQGI